MTTPATDLPVTAYFVHLPPTRDIVFRFATDLTRDGIVPTNQEIAARIRAMRKLGGNCSRREIDAGDLAEAISFCYADHHFWDSLEMPVETSGGETWADRQPDGKEVARVESSWATYTITRKDMLNGVRGYHVAVQWWD